MNKFIVIFLFLFGFGQPSTAQEALNMQAWVFRYIEINVPSRQLFVKENGQILKSYPVGLGMSKAFMTPIGTFKITNKDTNPGWAHPLTGEKILPGPKNPLGSRWMGFYNSADGSSYGIHGTNKPESIGKFVSHGCVRMLTKDAEELFEMVSVGTSVVIKYDRVALQQDNNSLLLTIYPDPYGLKPLSVDEIVESVEKVAPNVTLNKAWIAKLLEHKTLTEVTKVVGYFHEEASKVASNQ
jgi:hypothetical protein